MGTSPTNDVAVLQLTGASGLATVDLGDSSSVQVGDAVTGVGNAGNEAGTSAATGEVTALDQDITASDGTGTDSEQLTGLIMTNAAIEAGDSGGPLYDAQGQVVGIDTAAQTSGRSGQTVAGYAIPIDTALAVADQITSGVDNATIHQGLPAFLGIQTAQDAATGFGQVGQRASAPPPAPRARASPVGRGGQRVGRGRRPGSRPARRSPRWAARRSRARPTSPPPWPTHDPGDRVAVAWTDASGTAHRHRHPRLRPRRLTADQRCHPRVGADAANLPPSPAGRPPDRRPGCSSGAGSPRDLTTLWDTDRIAR